MSTHISMLSAPQTIGFKRMFAKDKLTVGIYYPIASYDGDIPNLVGQEKLAEQADLGGFSAIWSRDVPLRDPYFGDVGHVMDPWIWMAHMISHVKTAALATGSIILPLHHPIDIAKSAASIDQLSGGRLVLGVATGDRPVEFPAFNVEHSERGQLFRESLEYIETLFTSSAPVHKSSWGEINGQAELIPKPIGKRIPIGITGGSQQTMLWNAQHADFWLTYPRPISQQGLLVQEWNRLVKSSGSKVIKPVAQSLYIDLDENPDAMPIPIRLGLRSGRKGLIYFLKNLEQIGIGHVAFNVKFNRRPLKETLQELIEEVIPHFPRHGR